MFKISKKILQPEYVVGNTLLPSGEITHSGRMWLRMRQPCLSDCNPEDILVPTRYILPRGIKLATLRTLRRYAILLEARFLEENLALTTMSPSLRHAAKANTLTDGCVGQLNGSTHAARSRTIDLEQTDVQPGGPALHVGRSTPCCLITPHPGNSHCNSVKVR